MGVRSGDHQLVAGKQWFEDSTQIDKLVLGHETLSGTGNPDVDIPITLVTTTGSNTGTLGNGTYIGQIKIISHDVDGGSYVLTITTTTGASNTVTFTAVGETLTLVWTGTGWACISRGVFVNAAHNAVSGLPAITTP